MWVAGATLSYCLFSLMIFLGATFHIISPIFLWTTFLISLAVLPKLVSTLPRHHNSQKGQRAIYMASFVAILPFLHTLLLPAVATDDLIYHLFVPKQILATGAHYANVHNINSNMPMLFEYPLVFFTEYLGLPVSTVNFCMLFAIIASLLSWSTSLHRKKMKIMLLIGLTMATIPICYQLVLTAYVELFLTLLTIWAYFFYLDFLENKQTSTWILVCVLMGAMCSTKYTGLVLAFPVFFHHYFCVACGPKKLRAPSQHPTMSEKWLFWVGVLTFLIIVAPWLIKNYHYTDNPLFPFVPWLFETPGFSVDRWLRYQDILTSYSNGREWSDFALLPLRLLTGWNDAVAFRRGTFDGQLSVVFVISLFALGWKSTRQRLLTGSFVLFFLTWAAYSQQVRFLLPILAVLLAEGLRKIFASQNKQAPLFLTVLLVAALLQNSRNLIILNNKLHIEAYLLGQLSRDEYATKNIPNSYIFAKTANSMTEEFRSAKIYTLGNFGRNYYYNIDTLIDSYYDSEVLESAFQKGKTNPSIWTTYLQKQKITHVLIEWNFLKNIFESDKTLDYPAMRKFVEESTTLILRQNSQEIRRITLIEPL